MSRHQDRPSRAAQAAQGREQGKAQVGNGGILGAGVDNEAVRGVPIAASSSTLSLTLSRSGDATSNPDSGKGEAVAGPQGDNLTTTIAGTSTSTSTSTGDAEDQGDTGQVDYSIFESRGRQGSAATIRALKQLTTSTAVRPPSAERDDGSRSTSASASPSPSRDRHSGGGRTSSALSTTPTAASMTPLTAAAAPSYLRSPTANRIRRSASAQPPATSLSIVNAGAESASSSSSSSSATQSVGAGASSSSRTPLAPNENAPSSPAAAAAARISASSSTSYFPAHANKRTRSAMGIGRVSQPQVDTSSSSGSASAARGLPIPATGINTTSSSSGASTPRGLSVAPPSSASSSRDASAHQPSSAQGHTRGSNSVTTPTASSTPQPSQPTQPPQPQSQAQTQQDAAQAAQTRKREHEREAARRAERENWERTRGAGSSVLKLVERDSPVAASPGQGGSGGSGGTGTGEEQAGALSAKDPMEWTAEDVLPKLEELEGRRFEPVEVPSADLLLSRGISEYTFLPKILGRGKFSTVFLAVKNDKRYAIKHTALFPHHQLIATRLLREPTLLAELPPHPNLVTVNETIRTPGHFYLVEEFLGDYVTLEALLPMMSRTQPPQYPQLPLDVAEKVLTQLLSAVHAIHHPLQICHRDIKPENILIHPETLQLKLLDFGLATHFSKSEPKLSTCCGSPAFHCPEIVKALASPPGAVQYWGPEVDAWTCGITMLRVLTGVRYPLGASHASLRSMAIRAQRAVAMIQDQGMREKVAMLVEMDSAKRMRYFKQLVQEQERAAEGACHGLAAVPMSGTGSGEGHHSRPRKDFKSTTFIPTEPVHTMSLPLLVGTGASDSTPNLATTLSGRPSRSGRQTPHGSRAPSRTPSRTHSRAASPARLSPPPNVYPSTWHNQLVLLNPTGQPPQRLLSFIKYCLRCAGVLYHCWPEVSHLHMPASAMADGNSAAPLSAMSGTFSVPGTPILERPPSPTTPMFTLTGEKFDGLGQTYIFECVMELVEPEPAPEESLSLVQTIMAAFGRRTSSNNTNKRSSSTPAKQLEPGARASADTHAKPSPGPSGKDGQIRCLTFYMIVRFPKVSSHNAHAHHAKPGYSRASSAFGRRSRASSAADYVDAIAANNASSTTSSRSSHDLQVPESPISPSFAPSSARALTMEASEARGRSQHIPSSSASVQEHTLNVVTTSESVLNLAVHPVSHTPPSSRPTSRVRVSSNASLAGTRKTSRKSKVVIQISDTRAYETIKAALSVGGTQDSSDMDDESVTDGNETDSSRRSANYHRTSLLRSQSEVDFAVRSPSRGAEARIRGDSGSSTSETRGRQPRRITEEFRPELTVGSPVKEESPSSFDIEAMINECGSEIDKLLRHNHALDVEVDDAKGAVNTSRRAAMKRTRDTLLAMSRRFSALEQSDPVKLASTLSPWTFNLFSAVSPSLGIDPEGIMAIRPHPSPAEGAVIRFLSADILTLAARHLSPREVFVAVQERLELMLAESSPKEAEQPDDDTLSKMNDPPKSPAWSGALEMAGLLKVLSIAIPRLQSKKPHKFTEALADTLPKVAHHVIARLQGDDTEGTERRTDEYVVQRDAAVSELCESSCRLVEMLAKWEQAMLTRSLSLNAQVPAEKKLASADVLTVLLGIFSAMLPALPLPDAYPSADQTLSGRYFQAIEPRYVVSPANRPVTTELSSSIHSVDSAQTISPSSGAWQIISEATSHLHTNLVELVFERPHAEQSELLSARQGTVALGGFLLLVHLLARDKHNDSLGVAPPQTWSPREAEALLERSLPILMAGLGTRLPPTVSASGGGALGGAGALADTALLWLMWCCHAISASSNQGDFLLKESTSLPVIHLLASHAALSAIPSSRHISVYLLKNLLVDHIEEQASLAEIKVLISETSYPPLKAACVGLLKDVLDAKSNRAGSLFWSKNALDELLPTILVPVELPLPEKDDMRDLEGKRVAIVNALEEKTSWITEVANLLFYIFRRDGENKTGVRDASNLAKVSEKFILPVNKAVNAWTEALRAQQQLADLDDEIRAPLSILRIALERIQDLSSGENSSSPSHV